jgi:hypothetical protein
MIASATTSGNTATPHEYGAIVTRVEPPLWSTDMRLSSSFRWGGGTIAGTLRTRDNGGGPANTTFC